MLQVLQPLKVADCHSPSITQDIRQELNSFCKTNLLSLESGGAVGCLYDQLAFEEMSVDAVDGHLQCGWHENIA